MNLSATISTQFVSPFIAEWRWNAPFVQEFACDRFNVSRIGFHINITWWKKKGGNFNFVLMIGCRLPADDTLSSLHRSSALRIALYLALFRAPIRIDQVHARPHKCPSTNWPPRFHWLSHSPRAFHIRRLCMSRAIRRSTRIPGKIVSPLCRWSVRWPDSGLAGAAGHVCTPHRHRTAPSGDRCFVDYVALGVSRHIGYDARQWN